MAAKIDTRLKAAETFRLAELVRDKYAESGMNDKEFAAMASEKFGRPISESSVGVARDIFGIANKLRPVPKTDSERIAKLEERIEFLTQQESLHRLSLNETIARLDKLSRNLGD